VIQNVILDWSGTLADDLAPVVAATNAIFRDYGRAEMTVEEFRQHFRLPFAGFWAEFLPEATIEGLEELYHRFFVHLQDQVDLLPGAMDFLEFCRGTNRRLFLLSTIKREHFETQSARLGVRHFFEEAVVEAYDKRERITFLLRERGMDPRNTIFIGDMVHDIETARHGGVLGVAVLTGFDSVDKLLPARPALIAENLGAIRALLG